MDETINTTPKNLSLNLLGVSGNGHSSSNNHRNQASFHIVKCHACQTQFIKKDFNKHDDKTCKSFIESYFQLSVYNDDKIFGANGTAKDLPSNLFENPFLIGMTFLYTSSIVIFSEDKLKLNFGLNSNQNIILLSPELMQHSNLNDGDYVSIVDLNENLEKNYFIVQSCSLFKNVFSVGFPKHNCYNKKNLSLKSSILRIRLKITCSILENLHVQIDREFSDPIIYLNVCSNIKKYLQKKVFDSSENVLSVVINDIEYELKIKNVIVAHKDSLEKDFRSLFISRKDINFDETNQAYVITENTKIIFSPLKLYDENLKFVGYEKQCKLLQSLIIKRNENQVLNLPKTILLTGPSGVGKTLVIRNLIRKLDGQMNIINISSALLLSKNFEFDKFIQIFKNLIKIKPSFLFMDNLEDISNEKSQLEKRIVSWLKAFFDDLPKKENVIILAATSKPDLLDNSLRRPGRFDIEIDFPIPSPSDRTLIFKEILNHFEHNLLDNQIENLAEVAHGFTGADLESLCRNYLLNQMENDTQSNIINYNQLLDILSRTKPSTMREIILETPNVRWSDIGGLDNLKHLLEECIVWPIKKPQAFLRLGIDPPKGILMYGPPGCCKTMIGKALANESGLNFFSIKGPELFSKWVGESERAIREIFRKARNASPSILFFDEIDALASERGQKQSNVSDRVLAQLLTEIDGIEKLSKVIIIAATNRPDIVDKALLRPGRLDSIVYVPLPNFETRKEIFKIRLAKMPLNEQIKIDDLIENLAKRSEGYSGAEINAICQRAALLSIRENSDADSILPEYFIRAFYMVIPQTSEETIAFYENFANKFNLMI